jgi:hypothetical protein
MQTPWNGKLRGGTVLCAVLLGHVLLASFLLRYGPPLRRPAAPLDQLTLVYLPPPPKAMLLPAQPERPPPKSRTPLRNQTPLVSAPSNAPNPSMPPSDLTALPPIDWTDEQQEVARSKGADLWKQFAKHCREAEANHLHPPECHPNLAPVPWEPEEKRFGFAGPLPYVRLGPCVLGLGFWGCGLGKAPPGNSHLFDSMRNPDRSGSVPDSGGYVPPPEPREPLH